MDQETRKAQTRERVKRYREKEKSVTSDSVTPRSVTDLPPAWEYINKHGIETVQAIVTSLGKYADEVFLGKVTAKHIRDVIGEGPAIVHKQASIFSGI